MAGRLEIFDVSLINLISIDYLGQQAENSESSEGMVWVKNTGDAQVSNIDVTPTAIPGNDGITYLELSAGNPLSVPSNLAVTKQAGTGTIANPTTRYYKVSTKGAGDGETVPAVNVSISTVAGDVNVAFNLTWDAVTDALGYVVYTSIDNITYYKIADTIIPQHLVTSAAYSTAAANPVTQSRAYRATSFGTAAINIGDLDPGFSRPIFYKSVVPAGVTATGNRRRAKIALSGTTL